jgi:hypothetical protein
MYARVARWEGAEAEAMRRSSEQINAEASSGPPEGVPAKGLLLLIDPDNGRGLAVSLFETLDDLRKGDEVLNSMSPPDDAMGRRTAVEVYEVAADIRT